MIKSLSIYQGDADTSELQQKNEDFFIENWELGLLWVCGGAEEPGREEGGRAEDRTHYQAQGYHKGREGQSYQKHSKDVVAGACR